MTEQQQHLVEEKGKTRYASRVECVCQKFNKLKHFIKVSSPCLHVFLCFDRCNQVTSVVFKLFLHIMYTIVQMELWLSLEKPLRGYYVFKNAFNI